LATAGLGKPVEANSNEPEPLKVQSLQEIFEAKRKAQ
jgi:hypothetical protein